MNYFKKNCINNFVKKLVNPIRRIIHKIYYGDQMPLFWFLSPNWGDALNPILVAILSGRSVCHTQADYCDRYIAIGSILGNANARTTVWGSGFIKEGDMVQHVPKMIYAVRGPLTRAALLDVKIKCPEVYGDPALLLPLFFDPQVEVKYKVGIIPHYVDKNNLWVKKYQDSPGVLIIDVEGDIWDFVRAIKSCEVIVSSSLHGLICADAYGVRNSWIQLSENIFGGDFKFRDYLLSIGVNQLSGTKIQIDTDIDNVIIKASNHVINLDLRKLLLACPFLSESLRLKVESMTASEFSKKNCLKSYCLYEQYSDSEHPSRATQDHAANKFRA